LDERTLVLSRRKSEIRGPINFLELASELRRSPMGLNTLVWVQGMSDWMQASAHSYVLERMGPPPPPRRATTAPPLIHDFRGQRIAAAPDTQEDDAPAAAKTFHPWRRYFARMLDVFLVGCLYGLIVSIYVDPDSGFGRLLQNTEVVSVLATLLLLPLEGLMLEVFGTTPGKALYGIAVRQTTGEPLQLGQAFWRAFAVWFRGMAMGLPFVSLISNSLAYRSSVQNGVTSWDRDGGFAVQHSRFGFFRIAAVSLAWIAVLALIIAGGLLQNR
jgi:hypothetical protein